MDFRALLQRWGARIVGGGQPTHQDRHGARRIDFLAVELHAAAAWDTTCRWHPQLSDHAVLHGRCRPGGASRTRTCNPTNLAQLPAEAWTDLRRVHAGLDVTLGVPSPGPITPHYEPYARPEQGVLPAWHPAREAADGPDHAALGSSGPGEEGRPGGGDRHNIEQEVPICPVVAAYGRICMQAGLEAWWGRWRRRNGAQHGHARGSR